MKYLVAFLFVALSFFALAVVFDQPHILLAPEELCVGASGMEYSLGEWLFVKNNNFQDINYKQLIQQVKDELPEGYESLATLREKEDALNSIEAVGSFITDDCLSKCEQEARHPSREVVQKMEAICTSLCGEQASLNNTSGTQCLFETADNITCAGVDPEEIRLWQEFGILNTGKVSLTPLNPFNSCGSTLTFDCGCSVPEGSFTSTSENDTSSTDVRRYWRRHHRR